MTHDVVLRSRRAILPDGEHPAAIAITDGRIADIAAHDAPLPAHRDEDYGTLPLLPGLVDTHVHVNEPGRTHWEGFATATRAAAAGGVTTIVDMPLNSLPPTVDPEALGVKRSAADGQVFTDVGFWGGAIPANLGRLKPLHDSGVFGFKCFTAHSGVDEFPPLDPDRLHSALAEAARIDVLVIVHAEEPGMLDAAPAGADFAGFVASRPSGAEVAAIRQVIDAARHTGARVHILHLSAAEALDELRAARHAGLPVTAETCPHYLVLDAAEVPDLATQFKCCPPIRDAANREALWTALADGLIDCVVSDHSPCPPELKQGDFGTAWGGIASVQLGLSLIWTAARERGHSLSDVATWMATAPASLVGLHGKGSIAIGNDADLTVFDPERRWRVRGAELHHRHPITAYEGRELTGTVTATWLRGRPVGATPHGRLLSKE
ncbi:allantoinase AllB [Stackebrandtia nassauensis]|uniref:allantoinase n=1 Tax=Stackebrandtia nassauensis (strain DSM 44728 / CIP 108903 / NRRL B-16338 / NBRC 102104 / LLR-40K-21) TaxID=446470 RepID=D3Q656_STANL|nr:allantoinase AllB [Stackebrandtia nassauensis]ADD42231.1 allantoinase [Stackebrandtia nassauensis DSM 44728]